MKKMLLLLVACTGMQAQLSAQSYIPMLTNGNTWYQTMATFTSQEHYAYRVLRDTLLHGKTCKKMVVYSRDSIPKPPGYFSLREDIAERKVYSHDINTGQENLLYDFSLQIGDYYDFKGTTYKVIRIDTVPTLSGTYHKWTLQQLNWQFGYLNFMEGIGSYEDLLMVFNDMGDPAYMLDCFYSGNKLVYPTWGNCGDSINTGLGSPVKKQPAGIYPNPVDDKLTITNADGYSYAVYDLMGRVLASGEVKGAAREVPAGIFPKGCYILYLSLANQGNGQSAIRFIKR